MTFSHTKATGSAGRFGPRYGVGVRRKITQIEVKQKSKHKCPRCKSITKLKRIAIGIWKCPKCNFTFAGGAWIPQTILGKTLTPEEFKKVEIEKVKWRESVKRK